MFDTIRTQAMRRTRRAGALRTGIRAEDRRPGSVTVYGPGVVPAAEPKRGAPAAPLLTFGLPAVPMSTIPVLAAPVTRDSFAGWETEEYFAGRRGTAAPE